MTPEASAAAGSAGDEPGSRTPQAAASAGPASNERQRRRWPAWPLALLAYAAIAVLAYLPTLPLDGSHTQICTCGDTAQQVWFLSWVPFALTHGHSLFFSNWVMYPHGVDLADNTAMTLLGLLAAPVTKLAGPVAAYNVVLRAAFTLSALAMFGTVRRFTRWWPAAFLAGLLYGFSPFMAGQGLSHEFLVFAPIPPLVFGILAGQLGDGRMPPRRAGVLLGLLFAAQFLIAAETFAVLVLFTALGVAAVLTRRAARTRLERLLQAGRWAAVVCGALIAYPAYVFVAGPQHIVGSPHPLASLYAWHADLLGALLPSPLMRFAPAGMSGLGAQLVAHNLQENGTYLGAPLVLLAIALGVIFRRNAVTAVAGVLAVVCYALSLGPWIYVANHRTIIPGPFQLMAHLPVLQDIEPVRLSLFTALFTAIVLGTGLDELRRRAATRAGRAGARAWLRPSLAAALGLAALIPLLPRWPYPAGPATTPRFFTSAAVTRIPPGAVVVTFPYPLADANEALAWQAVTSMRFRLLGGATFFVPGASGQGLDSGKVQLSPPGIEQIFRRAIDRVPGPHPRTLPSRIAEIRADLRIYHVSAILIDPLTLRSPGLGISYVTGPRPHALSVPPGLALAIRYITAATGRPPISSNGVLAWFHLRATAAR